MPKIGLVHYMQQAGSLGVLDRASTALATTARVGTNGQHCDRCLRQLAGLSMITSHVTTRPPSPPLESDVAQVAVCHPHPGGAQSCNLCALTTAHVPRRMATPS